MDRPGRKPVHLSFVEGAGTGEGHERRVEGGGEVVEAEKLPLGGDRGVERRLHVGPDGAGGQLQVQVRPGAPASVREPICDRWMLALTAVAGVVAEYGVYGEGVRPQRIQGETELRSDTQRQLEVAQVMAGHLLDTVAGRCGYLDQTLHGLCLETARIEAFRPCRLPGTPTRTDPPGRLAHPSGPRGRIRAPGPSCEPGAPRSPHPANDSSERSSGQGSLVLWRNHRRPGCLRASSIWCLSLPCRQSWPGRTVCTGERAVRSMQTPRADPQWAKPAWDSSCVGDGCFSRRSSTRLRSSRNMSARSLL